MRESDVIDPSVGFANIVQLGQRVEAGQPLDTVHAANEPAAEAAARALQRAVTIRDIAPEAPPLIHERVS